MPLPLWPELDRRLWEQALTPGTILDDDIGARAHYSAISNRKVEKGYGRFLTYCTMHEPASLSQEPGQRISSGTVRRYVLHLTDLGNSTQTVLCRLQELGEAAQVMAPAENPSFINQLASRVRAHHEPARSKSHIVLSDELAELGFNLMEKAETRQGLAAATLYRDGLMIALLAYVPIRRKNFAQLAIGSSLEKRHGQWFISLAPEDTKTHSLFETVLPPSLEPCLEVYLARYRTVLAQRSGRWHKPVARRSGSRATARP